MESRVYYAPKPVRGENAVCLLSNEGSPNGRDVKKLARSTPGQSVINNLIG